MVIYLFSLPRPTRAITKVHCRTGARGSSGCSWTVTVRLERLQKRGWSGKRLEEAFQDAELLRKLVARRVDTGKLSTGGVAEQVLLWLSEAS